MIQGYIYKCPICGNDMVKEKDYSSSAVRWKHFCYKCRVLSCEEAYPRFAYAKQGDRNSNPYQK